MVQSDIRRLGRCTKFHRLQTAPKLAPSHTRKARPTGRGLRLDKIQSLTASALVEFNVVWGLRSPREAQAKVSYPLTFPRKDEP